MSSQDKVIQFHISRLKDKNQEVLLRTIKELVQLGARAEPALAGLEELFRTAPDPEVKQAAQQAGRIIFTAVQAEEDV